MRATIKNYYKKLFVEPDSKVKLEPSRKGLARRKQGTCALKFLWRFGGIRLNRINAPENPLYWSAVNLKLGIFHWRY